MTEFMTEFMTRSGMDHESRRLILAGLLRRHVRRVPLGPVLIALAAEALLVLAVSLLGAAHRTGEVVRRGERRFVRVHAPREALRDFMQDERVAIGVAERRVRRVAAPLRIGTHR